MDINELKKLAGVSFNRSVATGIPNLSYTGSEKSELMRKYNIKPGTDEWFRLWFARPYMTGEKPIEEK